MYCPFIVALQTKPLHIKSTYFLSSSGYDFEENTEVSITNCIFEESHKRFSVFLCTSPLVSA